MLFISRHDWASPSTPDQLTVSWLFHAESRIYGYFAIAHRRCANATVLPGLEVSVTAPTHQKPHQHMGVRNGCTMHVEWDPEGAEH